MGEKRFPINVLLIKRRTFMKTDVQIAQEAKMKLIKEVADYLGFPEEPFFVCSFSYQDLPFVLYFFL